MSLYFIIFEYKKIFFFLSYFLPSGLTSSEQLWNTVGDFVPPWVCSWETDLRRFHLRWPSFSEQQLLEPPSLSLCIHISPSLHCDCVWLDFFFFLFPLCFNFHSFPGIAVAQYRSRLRSSRFCIQNKNRSVWNGPKNIFCFCAWVTSDFHQIW